MNRTPDEIKKGLECCARLASCNECPYQVYVDGSFGCDEQGCDDALLPDALAYIQQLEAERDAAVAYAKGQCHACKFRDCDFTEEPCHSCFAECKSKWVWRGVQKEE